MLDKMISAKSITAPGANFIRKALDPFHDFEVRLDGIPDENTSRVVIQEVTLSQTISVPTGITGNWDAHIFTLPELATLNTAVGANLLGTGTITLSGNQPASGLFPAGLVNVMCVPSGGITTPTGASYGSNSVSLPFDFSAYFSGQKRLIALAFEVHDTSAELYKQGTITVYRLPQTKDISNIAPFGGLTGSSSSQLAVLSRLPPSNLASALLLTGSRQWEMKDGAYVVAVQDVKNNMLTGSVFASHVFTAGDPTNSGESVLWQPPNYGTTTVAITAPTGTAYWNPQPFEIKPVPFHTAGCYCTGLNNNSTFTVTARAIFESAPTPDNTQLVVLAQPSPDYDPVALELYKAAASKLPVGVPVGENASGDFWDKVLSAIESAAPMVGGLFGPIGGALGGLAGKAASIGKTMRNKEPSDRKQVQGNFAATGSKNVAPTPAPRKRLPLPPPGRK